MMDPTGEVVDFSTRGFQLPQHVLTDPVSFLTAVAFFLAVRDFTIKYLWRTLALTMMYPGIRWSPNSDDGSVNPTPCPYNLKEINKFIKYCWHGSAYLCLLIWGIWLLQKQQWSFDVDQIWKGYPHSGTEKLLFRIYMTLQMGWYGHGFIESLLVDSSRRDYYLMLLHHILSVCLLGGAYWGNAHRCAISVCVEQDLSDTVLYISKVIKECKYFRITQKSWVVTFLCLCIWSSWLVTRILILGWIITRAYAVHYFESGVLNPSHSNFDWLSVYLVVQLTILWVLQVIWWIGICSMTWSQVTRGSHHDMWHDSNRNVAKEKEK